MMLAMSDYLPGLLLAIARPEVSWASRAIEPFTHDFMLWAMLIAALIGAVSAMLSCYLVLKGWSLMGDAISHAVLPGIILASVINLPMAIGAFIAGMLCAISTGWIKSHSRVKEDTVLGIVFTGLFALGLVMMTKIESSIHYNHILLGNLLGIETHDMIQVAVSCGIVLVVTLVKRRDLLLLCFDPAQAKASGLNTTFLYYLLLGLIAMTVVASLQAVGFILTVAMLITPGAIGFMLTDRFGKMLWIATGSAVFASVGGTYISFFLDISPAGFIVLIQAAIFLLAVVFAPKHGLISRKRQVRAAMRGLAQ